MQQLSGLDRMSEDDGDINANDLQRDYGEGVSQDEEALQPPKAK